VQVRAGRADLNLLNLNAKNAGDWPAFFVREFGLLDNGSIGAAIEIAAAP
jgi:hypothetical protein